jgi:signal peptidase
MTATAPDLRSGAWDFAPEATPRRVRRPRRARRWVLRAFSLVALLVVAAPVAATIVPRLNGGAAVRVHSDSMGDTHPVGSIVLTQPVQRSSIEPGDVVVIQKQHEAPVLHRVAELGRVNGRLAAKTKGDANPKPDPKLFLLPKQVLVARHTLPYLGYLLAVVTTPLGWALLMVAPAAAITASWLVQIWSPTSFLPPIRWQHPDHALSS